MINCLKIVVVDTDPDYLYIEIFASSSRFSGATRVFSGYEHFKEFAEVIAGFPTSPADQRSYVFGTKEKGFAGGYSRAEVLLSRSSRSCCDGRRARG